MTAIEATRKWVREQCPLINKHNQFSVNYLPEKATTYTLDTAGESHRADVCGFDIMTCSLVFAARMPRDNTLATAITAADFFKGLTDWLRTQERAHNYPTGVDGYSVERITSANAGMLLQADANTAIYQLQIQLTLEEV